MGKPRWGQLVKELPELRLWCAVYLVILAFVSAPFIAPNVPLGLLADLALAAAIIGLMSIRQRSLSLGVYAVVAWLFHAAALPLGFFHRREPPDAWIGSRVLKDIARRP